MNQRIQTKVPLEPRSICIFRFLIYGERYSSNQSYASHGSCNSSKEPSKTFRLIGVTDAIGETVVIIGLHASLYGIQGKLSSQI